PPDLVINFTASVNILGTLFTATGGGGLYGGETGGLAFALLLTTSGTAFGDLMRFSGRFEVHLNTTSLSRTFGLSSNNVTVAPGTFKIHIDGSLQILNLITITGLFDLTVNGSGFDVLAQGTVNISPFGTLAVGGSLSLSSAGLVASLQIGAGTSQVLQGAGLKFTGILQLEINTTSSTATIMRLAINKRTGAVTGFEEGTLAAQTIRLVIGGELQVLSFSIKGQFELVIQSAQISVTFNAFLGLGGFGEFTVQGGATINVSPGYFVMYLFLGANAIDFGVIGITGNFYLRINTDSVAHTVGTVSVPGNTCSVQIQGKIKLWLLEANANFEIGVENSIFKIYVSVTVNVFNVVNLHVTGYVYSDGRFSISGSISFNIDLCVFVLEGGFSLTFANTGLSGRAWGSVDLEIGMPWPIPDIDITLAGVEASFSFRANGLHL
ncbi:MAG: hypothetical protein AAGU05_12400, partial [Anaerolineaceae bacterium]